MLRICIATSTRADWGLLSPLARVLREQPGVKLDILATNMHLLERYGMTVREIEADGFEVSARVPIDCTCPGEAERARAMARCLEGTADALERLRPDLLVILGDRYEMLAVASAAAVMRVPIAHIAGGEISEGAVDDSLRHAITKLSSLHLTATEAYRQRVIQMGEDPARVVNTGALGVWNIMHQPLMPLEELRESLRFDFTPGQLLLATYHPATLDDIPAGEGCAAMLEALDCYPEYKVILTYPNNDAGSEEVILRLQQRALCYDDRYLLVKSLGMRRYLSVLQYAAAVVGNSSSGIVEVPSMGIPTVDVGIRQRGRIAAPSVIHCGNSADDIERAISLALSPEMQELAALRQNPYAKSDTVDIMVRAITGTDPSTLLPKKFIDFKPERN